MLHQADLGIFKTLIQIMKSIASDQDVKYLTKLQQLLCVQLEISSDLIIN
jgi:hypothetical protein